MFNWFSKKAEEKDVKKLQAAVQTGFDKVRTDFSNTSEWIKHLDKKDSEREEEIADLYEEIATVRSEVENMKNVIDLLGSGRLFKQRQTVFAKQPAVEGVQTAVQTAVQSAFLDNLSVTERALVWILLNSDMKLSYADLAAMMGKDTATIRGQINRIKQKSEGLVHEQIEKNNKKRLYIPEKIRSALLKKAKVRVNRGRKSRKRD